MKILIGLLISFLVGAGCRFFDIPSPSPAGPSWRDPRSRDDLRLHVDGSRAEGKGSRCYNEASLRRTQRSVCQRHRAGRSPGDQTSMKTVISGRHNITPIAGDPQKHIDFYSWTPPSRAARKPRTCFGSF